MKKVLITGSNGQLGLELYNILKYKYELILTSRSNLDITNFNETIEFINKYRPDFIINCAAFTAVDLCETQEETAYSSNALGPKNLAIASSQIGAKLVHISTDYVFDGEGNKDLNGNIRPYTEEDKTNPQSAYGRTKLEGEKLVIENTNKYFIIRTAWLYGEGKNFVRTMINLSKTNSEVKVVNDQIGSPTSTEELSNMIEKLIETENYGVYHGTCEGYCSWYELTCEIYRLMDIKTKVIPVTTDEFPRPAKRPKYSVLENKKLNELNIYKFKEWQEALKIYLEKEKNTYKGAIK
ncbi:MAG: dTDP-4-dehydrorhamnose reductase [Sedimentibacter saalensis]|uniref:dTDP-4-dehydrorhamnose reductase n=1 Tax=Sedimentibacter saalensis TaxID=130788 RepID=UPI003159576B